MLYAGEYKQYLRAGQGHLRRRGNEYSLTPGGPETLLNGMDALCCNSMELIQYTRRIAASQINREQLMNDYDPGCWIVEEQQSDEYRAGHGKKVIQTLLNKRNEESGKGFLNVSIL